MPGAGDRRKAVELSEASVDGVFCSLVIDHMDGPTLDSFIKGAHRVLKKGGWLFISDVNPYFQTLVRPYARFLSPSGTEVRIRVEAHGVATVSNLLHSAGLWQSEVERHRTASGRSSRQRYGLGAVRGNSGDYQVLSGQVTE